MELIEQSLLLLYQVLVLLESDFILPFDLLKSVIVVENTLLAGAKFTHDDIVSLFLLLESDDFLVGFVKRLNDLVVFIFLVGLLSSGVGVFLSFQSESVLQVVDDIKVGVGDIGIIGFNIGVLLSVFASKLLDSQVLLFLDHFDLKLPLIVHFFSKELHLMLVFLMDFVRDSLEVVSQLSLLLVLVSGESVEVLLMSDFLLFLAHFKRSEILLELSFVGPVFILDVLKCDLGFFLQLGELIEVLENQMLASLLVDLKLNLVLLVQVLELSILVSQLSLSVLELFLTNEPEVVNSKSLIVEETSHLLFVLNLLLEVTALKSQRLDVLFIHDVIGTLGTFDSFIFK